LEGDSGWETKRKRGGRSTGGGRRGVGSGIPKVAGSGRKKRKNNATLCNILHSKKCEEAGANKYGAGTGMNDRMKGYGKGEV